MLLFMSHMNRVNIGMSDIFYRINTLASSYHTAVQISIYLQPIQFWNYAVPRGNTDISNH